MKSFSLIRGFTLIELAVVLAITAILLSQAVPMFTAWSSNVQIRTATESIQDALQLARAEALRRNRSVMFWLSSPATPPQADWLVGCWSPVGAGVQPEAPGDCPGPGSPPAGTPVAFNWIQRQLASDQQTTQPQLTITPPGATYVTFNSLGMVANPDGSAPITQIDIAIPTMPVATARPLRVLVSSGEIRMCDPALTLANDPRGCQ